MSAFKPLDPAQREASEVLLALHQELLAAKADAPSRGLWGQIRSKIRGPSSPIPGVYLWGGVGRGKTYLMDWFVKDLELPGKRRVHFHHFMRDIHEVMSGLPKQPDPLEVVADRLRAEVRVLCLDEFLVTDITDAMLLHGLLRALFSRGMTLVTTANTPPSELYRNGLQRQSFLPAIDLLKQHTRVMELDGGTDYRLRALTQEGVFFEAEHDGEQRLADYFERLTGGHRLPDREIRVNGRSFPVRGLGMDVIWLDFDTLCGTPRSAADYIELAKEYHSVLLSGVPELGPRQEAAARRFLHLVDELYDQRVKLVLSARAPLEALYLGGLQEFAHERLLSRLAEMQSTDYLAAAVPEG
ncbi:cell division protein ZapE [Thiorhodococcus mannitoliphagus]|uniref:Cell division protein ZapE n=1 Tax=Thiorhodococcus mannitoliphagus TaxID=329406 RepID=A0A6P1DXR9_9GAMM|nr:cell division protein ZapE [Thiorhodococcus mannitoliphagus]NEX21781.1 cell division protein ZapE [Thiorhodococcus mannitoliphagus]